MALAAILFQQAADDSLLSDAGNIAAIVAAALLVLGLVCGWFRQVAHSLHVTSERVALGVDGEGDLQVSLGLGFLNTAPIALSFEIVAFRVSIDDEEVDLADGQRGYAAPEQRLDWYGKAQTVHYFDFPLSIEARYEIQYARKSSHLWWWRRALRGSFRAELPAMSREGMVLSEPLDGPPTDSRVPWTSKTLLGWRL